MTKLYLRKKDLELARLQLETQQLQDPYSSTLNLLKTMSLLNHLDKEFRVQNKNQQIAQNPENQTDSAENFEITPE